MSHSQGCRVQLNIERVLMTMIKEGKSASLIEELNMPIRMYDLTTTGEKSFMGLFYF